MANPIWKDYFVELGTASQIQFRIVVDGTNVIYTGVAHKRPGENKNKIKINEICADWLSNSLPMEGTDFTNGVSSERFTIQTYISTAQGELPDWEDLTSVEFINDWSYDDTFSASTMGLSFPIKKKVSPKQKIYYTTINRSSEDVYLEYKDGSSEVVAISAITTDEITDETIDEDVTLGEIDEEMPLFVSGQTLTTRMVVVNLANYSNLNEVTIGAKNYMVDTNCNRYVLHYVNAFGGWDSFLIEGNTTENDTLTRSKRMVEYNNSSKINRGVQNYVNEIVKSFTMHTGLMTDDESLLMHHLIDSTCVYLEDTLEETIVPVIITNSTCEYKTFKNQGCKMVDYEIVVELAQERIRR